MVTMKLRRPYTTASMWSSGKITCTGANSEEQAKVAARKYARVLQKLGFNIRFEKHQNRCFFKRVNEILSQVSQLQGGERLGHLHPALRHQDHSVQSGAQGKGKVGTLGPLKTF